MPITLLSRENTGLVVVDVQTKLMSVMEQKKRVVDNLKKLIHLSKLFNIPVILTEQYPRMLGSTLSEIKEAFPVYNPIQKMHFNCCAFSPFNERLKSTGLINLILTGVETHICIFQTCLSLLERGYVVHVPQDAVDSRTDENRQVGIRLMEKAGAVITSTETVIFQILEKAGTKEFKEMLKLVK
jgi:nicotinamidase-related amidase